MKKSSGIKYEQIVTSKTKTGDEVMVGKTIATITGCSRDALHILEKLVNSCNGKSYRMAYEFTAKSKLNVAEGDVYDEDVGKKLAQERVLNKYHKALNRALCQALSEYRELVARLEHYMDKQGIEHGHIMTIAEIKRTKLNEK